MTALKNLFQRGIITIIIGLLAGAVQVAPPVEAQSPEGIVVDHTSVALFDDIPEEYIQAAENIDMLFMDRSVGMNIHEGLDCLSNPSDENASTSCTDYEHDVPIFSVSPSEVDWSRPGGYNRENWDFIPWPEGGGCSYWYEILDCFFSILNNPPPDNPTGGPIISQYDVVSFQYSYLEVAEGSTIANQPGGFFSDNQSRLDVNELEAYEAAHSDQIFIYWTSSLARSIGTTTSESFNNQMRAYAIANNKPLFDVADILSHDPDGAPCYDNRDGVPYRTENHPDDGLNIPAICQHYTTEVEGGHLGSVSAGKIRVAKAFWVLMAQIAGWTPDNSNPTPTPTPPPPLSLTGAAADETIHLFWEVNISLPPDATWEIIYSAANNDQYPPITGLNSSTRSYSLTSLTNYTHYTINLNAIADDTPLVTDTVTLFPTDQIVYLPIVLK